MEQLHTFQVCFKLQVLSRFFFSIDLQKEIENCRFEKEDEGSNCHHLRLGEPMAYILHLKYSLSKNRLFIIISVDHEAVVYIIMMCEWRTIS